MFLLRLVWAVTHEPFAKRAGLVAENLALRQELNVLRRKGGRPRLRSQDAASGLASLRFLKAYGYFFVALRP